ncbi:hypothetical protein MFUL124B02_25840 [Myxococcus fulvus 124B02]|nr:hypothetical protein MFUL124B02_25840 [Myxococcus fulvus 124B02]
MSERPQDRRPRVLDYSRPVDDVRAVQNLGWPCHAFRVTTPVRPPPHLNLFEELVLRLLDDARMDERRLAEVTTLDPSLLRLVFSRLRDQEFITEQNELADGGRGYLAQRELEEPRYEVRTVFRECISGALLPVMLADSLGYEELADWSHTHARIRQGERTESLRLLRSPRGETLLPPTPADVLRVAVRHAELGRQYAVLRSDAASAAPELSHVRQLSVDPEPELVFLRCRVVIPAASDDYRICDPFGLGFSDTLFRAYESLRSDSQEEQEFIRDLRKKSLTVRARTPKGGAREREAEKVVLERLGDSVSRFRELFSKLRQAEREIRDSGQPPRNSDEEAHFRYAAQQAAQSLAQALELALVHVVSGARAPACETLLASHAQLSRDNAALLVRLAQRLGFQTKGTGSLLHVVPGRIRGLRQGDVDLQALLAVALAAAAESPEHPLRALAAHFPQWLVFLRALKQMRDAGAHGMARKEGGMQLAALREGTYLSLEGLLPGLGRRSAGAGPVHSEQSMDTAHDDRRQALTRLEEVFGVQWYTRVQTDTAELFIQAELFAKSLRTEAEPHDVSRLVNDLSSLVQALVHRCAPAASEAPASVERPKDVAQRRALEAGLLRAGEVLPEALSRVQQRRIEEAMQGLSPSLGANVVALLVRSRLEWLQRLAKASPEFLKQTSRLLDLRGHGNRPVLMSGAQAVLWKDAVFQLCGALMEA